MCAPVLVQGPGAIGKLVAIRMAVAGLPVALLDHRHDRARALGAQELRHVVSGNRSEPRVITARLPVFHVEDRCPEAFGFLLCCVKAHDLGTALDAAARFLGDRPDLLVLANGIGNLETARSHWPEEQCCVGTTDFGALNEDDWTVRETGAGRLRIGPADQAGAWRELLDRAGLETHLEEDPDRAEWEKAIINCAINPVAALLRVTNGELLESSTFEVVEQIVAEVVEVVSRRDRDRGLDRARNWRAGSWTERVREVCRATAENRCSMLQDLEKGRRTEIGALNARVVELGERLGVAVPVNRTLARLIAALEPGLRMKRTVVATNA